MAYCLIHNAAVPFKAYIVVYATPNSTVTATIGSRVFSGNADSSGLVTLAVKKKGTYSVTSNATGTQTVSVTVSEMRATYTANVTGMFTLSLTNTTINNRTATTITVDRTSSPYAKAKTGNISSGANVYYGDVLKFTVALTNTNAYNTPSLKVNNTTTTSGSSYTVQNANVNGVASTTVKSFKLTISAGTGSSLGARRTGSQYQGAAIENVINGATVYYGDTFTTSGGANTGFDSYKVTSTGMSISGSTYTCTGTCSLKSTASPIRYTLTSTGINSNNPVTVRRTAVSTAGSAAGASVNVNLANGAAVYYGDTLQFTQAPATYYDGKYSATGLNSNISNQMTSLSRTVAGNVTVTSTATRQSINILCTGIVFRSSGYPIELEATFTISKGTTLEDNWGKTTTNCYYSPSTSTAKWSGTCTLRSGSGDMFSVRYVNDDGTYDYVGEFRAQNLPKTGVITKSWTYYHRNDGGTHTFNDYAT